jgi:hypothetical protein
MTANDAQKADTPIGTGTSPGQAPASPPTQPSPPAPGGQEKPPANPTFVPGTTYYLFVYPHLGASGPSAPGAVGQAWGNGPGPTPQSYNTWNLGTSTADQSGMMWFMFKAPQQPMTQVTVNVTYTTSYQGFTTKWVGSGTFRPGDFGGEAGALVFCFSNITLIRK